MAKQTEYHVVQRPNGQWAVQKASSSRALRLHDTKKEAVSDGVATARKNAPSMLKICRTDGSVQDERTYEA